MSARKRKVIQIATATDPNNSVIVALCDDGTIWKIWGGQPNWARVDTTVMECIPLPPRGGKS
jgi:hypothetical protein